MGLAERAGLAALVRDYVHITAKAGVLAEAKAGCLVAGMAAGADSIDDMNVLRHGAMPELSEGVRAPSTLGSFLRSFTRGSVRQLEKVNRELLAELARRAPLLPGAGQLAFVDADSMQKRVYGHSKQGAAFGHTKISGKTVLVRGLNALAATICTPQAAPVIAATRLRGGSASTARGAASLLAEAIGAARACGCTGRQCCVGRSQRARDWFGDVVGLVFGVRWLPVPAGGDRGRGPLVPAVRAVLPGR
jgi:hypothetical protein